MFDFSKSENWDSWENWVQTKSAYYGSKTSLQVYGGIIDFDPDKHKDLVGGEKITYDEYLDLQMMVCENEVKVRWHFARCYYYIPLEFAGEIERITGKAVCFKRIYISGMYPDGSCFDGKEDHVWIEKHGLESFGVGDCLSFFAEPYRYIKTGNGKQIDFGLRNPQVVKKIDKYELPSDSQLMMQSIDAITCEVCYLNEQCYGGMCIRNKNELHSLRKEMLKSVMGAEKSKEDYK
mgnify:CR=1 FL=1